MQQLSDLGLEILVQDTWGMENVVVRLYGSHPGFGISRHAITGHLHGRWHKERGDHGWGAGCDAGDHPTGGGWAVGEDGFAKPSRGYN